MSCNLGRYRFDGSTPPVAGKRIGIARIDHESSCGTERESCTAPFHLGRGASALCGDAGNCSAGYKLGKGQVAPAPVLVSGTGNTQRNAINDWHGGERRGEGGAGDRHEYPVAPSTGLTKSATQMPRQGGRTWHAPLHVDYHALAASPFRVSNRADRRWSDCACYRTPGMRAFGSGNGGDGA